MSEFWIQTFTGKKFDLLEPTEDMICIEDIARHLSFENRFNGATSFPYSVAQHSLFVHKFCDEEFKLEGLLHDAEEAYCKDLPTPLKRAMYKLGCDGYGSIIEDINWLIAEKYELNELYLNNKVKIIDLQMAKTERQLLVEPPEKWHHSIEDAKPFPITILERNWHNVEREFLVAFEKYKRN